MSSSVKSVAIKAAKFIALFFITLFLSIWLVSPYVSHHYADKYLSDQQLILADNTTIRYNPFDSSLVISDLEITTTKNTEKAVVAIKSLNAKVSLYRLLADTLHFSEFSIDGLYLDVNLNNAAPIIGGFVIENSDNESSGDKASDKVTTDLAKNQIDNEPNNYQISLPQFSITNAIFDIAIKQSQQEFTIDSLKVNNVIASANTQQAEVYLKALINKAPLSLNLNAQLENNQGEISSELEISSLNLAHFQPFLSALATKEEQLTLQGTINIQSKQTLSLLDKGAEINIEAFDFTTEDLIASHENKTLALNIDPLSLQNLSVELINEQAPLVKGTAKLNINSLIAYQDNKEQLLAKISAINLDEIKITTTESLITANITNLIIEESIFAENTVDELPPLAKFNKLSISDIEVSQQGVVIDTINLLGLGIDTNLDKNKNLVGLPLPPKNEQLVKNSKELTTEQANEVAVKTENTGSPFILSMNSFFLSDTSYINFTDRSTTPHYQRDFKFNQLNAGPFDNQKPQQESHIKLAGTSNKYAHFDLAAIAKPFSKQDFYKLKGFFKEVSLPSISTYISDAIKHELKSGQLDIDLDITVDNTEIDGNALLLLRGVELGAANDHEADTVKSQTSIPFNMALSMLKDSDGNVELDIPLEGSTDDPSFGMRGFISLMIKQATMSAAKEYLMTTFVPYANVVSVAMSAGDYLLKVRFNDLAFPVGETQLTPQHSEFLGQFIALMKDKPETQLTLCAIATPEDIKKPLGFEITDKDEVKQLAYFSEQRLNAFKDYMVDKGDISSSRLLLCSAKIDSSEGAKPRITFTD
jgi:hypothetical protein